MTDVRDRTLGDLVAANPAAARTLDRIGLDYCCHGERTLDQACRDAELDLDTVTAALEATPDQGDAGWTGLGMAELAEHILVTHHAYLHEELPAVDALAAKVLSVHGGRHPELAEVRSLVGALRADLEMHLLKEEHILFPAIEAIARGERSFHFGSVANPIRMMTADHDRAGELLAQLRSATGDFTVPDDGCASYRSLYERLEQLELDTHLHVLKENHTLFPAAIAAMEG